MKMYLLALFIICFSQILTAQNLVSNPSFEEFDTCPSGYGGNNLSTGWFPFRSSPDYFNECSSSSIVGVPKNAFGYQLASTGKAYCGFVSYHIFNDWNEMIGRKLSTTLDSGIKYYVSVKFSLANISPCAINKLGVLFTTRSYCDSLNALNVCVNPDLPIPNFAHVFSSKIIPDTSGWTTISGSFISDSAYQYIVIGNLFEYTSTDDSLLYGNTDCNSGYVYYYIDDVCVSTDSLFCDLPFSINNDFISDDTQMSPNPCDGYINIEMKNKEKFPISCDIYNVYGGFIKKINNSVFIDTSNFPSGIYFLQILLKENKIISKKIIVKH